MFPKICVQMYVIFVFYHPQQMCAVCLEEFKVKEELGLCPCTHAFHTK